MTESYEYFPNTKVTCPFDVSHLIEVQRLFVHLEKCYKVNKHSTNLICPFNSMHVCSRDEILKHVNECDSRQYAEMGIVQHETPVGFKEPPIQQLIVNQEENWDTEVLPTSVLSSVHEAQREQCFLIPVMGKTKSERKKIRLENVEMCKKSE